MTLRRVRTKYRWRRRRDEFARHARPTGPSGITLIGAPDGDQ
jgi:hypothetical protein